MTERPLAPDEYLAREQSINYESFLVSKAGFDPNEKTVRVRVTRVEEDCETPTCVKYRGHTGMCADEGIGAP